jgi:hypothetical protein
MNALGRSQRDSEICTGILIPQGMTLSLMAILGSCGGINIVDQPRIQEKPIQLIINGLRASFSPSGLAVAGF